MLDHKLYYIFYGIKFLLHLNFVDITRIKLLAKFDIFYSLKLLVFSGIMTSHRLWWNLGNCLPSRIFLNQN